MIEDILEGFFATSCGRRIIGISFTAVFGSVGIYLTYTSTQNFRWLSALFAALCLTTALLCFRILIQKKSRGFLPWIWLTLLLSTLLVGALTGGHSG